MIELSSSTNVYGSAEVVPAVSFQVKKREKLVLRRTSGSVVNLEHSKSLTGL